MPTNKTSSLFGYIDFLSLFNIKTVFAIVLNFLKIIIISKNSAMKKFVFNIFELLTYQQIFYLKRFLVFLVNIVNKLLRLNILRNILPRRHRTKILKRLFICFFSVPNLILKILSWSNHSIFNR